MTTLREIIRKKGSDVFSVSPDASVLEAIKMMADFNTGALLVMSGSRVEGILSEHDCVRRVDLHGRTAKDTPVKDIMTSKVLYAQANQSIEECVAIMIDKNIRHLPVYENGKLLGLISVRDVLREVVDYQKFIITSNLSTTSPARAARTNRVEICKSPGGNTRKAQGAAESEP